MSDPARSAKSDPLMLQMVQVLSDLRRDRCPCGHGGLTSVWDSGKMIAMTCIVDDCRFTRWIEEKAE